MGGDVLIRAVVVTGISLTLSGCANEQVSSQLLETSALTAASTAVEITPVDLPRKTLSDRVLAAIALERVTGLKPDPSRFAD